MTVSCTSVRVQRYYVTVGMKYHNNRYVLFIDRPNVIVII